MNDVLRDAAEAVCWFDWSDNDEDAVAAVERLRKALADSPQGRAEGLLPETADLVERFAAALKEKMLRAQVKYGYDKAEWRRDDWEQQCRVHLLEHLQKGDPRDVANYCAFMWHHGWSTATSANTAALTPAALINPEAAPVTPDTEEGK